MNDIDRENREYARQAALEQYRANSDARHSSFDATIRFAELAIKSLLVLCGGAAIAVLSFAGTRGATAQASLDAYAPAVCYFGIAAGGAVATAAISYLAQSFFTNDWDKTGRAFQGLAIILCLANLACFGIGVSNASTAVSLSRWEKFEIHP